MIIATGIEQYIPVIASILGGSGMAALLNYLNDKKTIDTTTQQGVNQQMLKVLEEDRIHCNERMDKLQARIDYLESQLNQIYENRLRGVLS